LIKYADLFPLIKNKRMNMVKTNVERGSTEW
jgi:hypothetical protein